MKLVFAFLAFIAGASAWNVAPQPIRDNPDVALAKAVFLAEHARQTAAALQGRPWAVPVAAPVVVAPGGNNPLWNGSPLWNANPVLNVNPLWNGGPLWAVKG